MENGRITSAREAIENAEKKVERISKRIAKLGKEIADCGMSYEEAIASKDSIILGEEAFKQFCRYEKIVGETNNLKKAEEAVEKKKEQLKKVKEQVRLEEADKWFLEHLPAVLGKLVEELESKWSAEDKKERDRLNAEYERLGRKAFHDRYGWQNLQGHTDGDIEYNNHTLAQSAVIDLNNRVKSKVGEVKDWSMIHAAGVALNGFVVGTEGKAMVETIVAGGYNIQRRHLRTLVKPIR